jgi:acylphosphatase
MQNNSEVSSLHAFVEGHVQGVGFRYFVKEKAESLGLTGWVRNLYNGSVEFTAQGDRDKIEQLLAEVRIGPSRSIVTNVVCEWSSNTKDYSQFSFLPSE